jgi:hypothetical protein
LASQGVDRRRLPAFEFGSAWRLGLLGLLSGLMVWVVISFVWEPFIGLDRQFFVAGWELALTHLTIVPGLLFGMIIALFLSRRGLAGTAQVLGYVAAAAISNFIAANVAANMVDAVDSAALLGILAGFVGATCLTALSLLLFPFLRTALAAALLIAAGTLLGSLLHVAIEDDSAFGLGFIILYAGWQAGYAAALGAALPPRTSL